MMKFLVTTFLLCTLLFAQSFSKMMISEDTYLNFQTDKKKLLDLYLDESSSLVWQNFKRLRQFNTVKKAQAYCKSLRLGEYKWTLPTLVQIRSLEMTSSLRFTKNVSYLLSDGPLWDNTLMYIYTPHSKTDTVSVKSKKSRYVRCVSSLED